MFGAEGQLLAFPLAQNGCVSVVKGTNSEHVFFYWPLKNGKLLWQRLSRLRTDYITTCGCLLPRACLWPHRTVRFLYGFRSKTLHVWTNLKCNFPLSTMVKLIRSCYLIINWYWPICRVMEYEDSKEWMLSSIKYSLSPLHLFCVSEVTL